MPGRAGMRALAAQTVTHAPHARRDPAPTDGHAAHSAGAVRKHAPAREQEGVGAPLHQVARQEVLRLALRGKVNKHSAVSVLSVQHCNACAIAAECAPIQAGRVASRPRPLMLRLSSAVRYTHTSLRRDGELAGRNTLRVWEQRKCNKGLWKLQVLHFIAT